MGRWAIVDTGPLVALLDRAQRHHDWSVRQVEDLDPPLLVCEPVLVETLFLLNKQPQAQDAIFDFFTTGVLRLAFRLDEHLRAVEALLKKYRDKPMSLADACLVRMAELFRQHHIFTLDSDFNLYRRFGRDPLNLIFPMPGKT